MAQAYQNRCSKYRAQTLVMWHPMRVARTRIIVTFTIIPKIKWVHGCTKNTINCDSYKFKFISNAAVAAIIVELVDCTTHMV